LCASFKEVDHSCHHCGATVEDGRPFCSQCRAPQIRVQLAVPDAVTPSELPAAEAALAPPQPSRTASSNRLDRRVAVRAALKAGVLGIFIGMIPFLGIVLTGSLAVYFYRRESGFALPISLASRLGGAAGIVVFAINAVCTILVIVLHAQQKCIDILVAVAQGVGANTADPNFQAGIRNLFTPSGLATTFIFALALASVGGALASLFMRPRRPRL
jgi:hypothetical protein